MSVDIVTGEVTADLSAVEARAITTRIKEAAESIWSLLLEAHDRKAWTALGYRTWADYVQVEFDMGRAHSYRLLDQGRVIREIGSVSPSGDIQLTEAETREIKPVLAAVKDEIAEAVKDIPADQPDVVQAKAREVIDQARSRVQAARPAPTPPTVEAPSIGDMNRDARATPSYIAGKAFDSLILAKKQIAAAGGVPRIIADLEGPDGQAMAENWLPAIESVRDLLDDWATRLQRKASNLRRVK